MAVKIDSLEIEIKSKASNAATAVDHLTASLKKLKALSGTGGYGLGTLARQLTTFSKSISKLDMDASTSKMLKMANGFKKIAENVNLINTSKLKQLNEAMHLAGAKNLGAGKVTKDIGDSAKTAKKEVKDLNKETEKATNATPAKGTLFGIFSQKGNSFLKSIGRIALYRGIRTAMKAVTTAIKEGTNNLYQYGKAMNSSFVQSLDSAATSVQYLKNGLAVGLAPVVQALVPVVVTLSDSLAGMGNAISEIYAKSQGQATFTKAVKSFKEFSAAADAAKNSVMGFDELNVINNNSGFAGMFEEVAVDTERANENLSKFRSIISSIVGLGIAGAVTKGLGSLVANGVLDIPIGKIALVASSVGLTVSGAIDIFGAIDDAMKNGSLDHGNKLELVKGLTETGAGLSLMLKTPIPLAITTVLSVVVAGDAISEELDKIVKDIQNNQATRSLSIPVELGLGMTSGGAIMLSDIVHFDFGNLLVDWGTFVSNLCIDIVNVFKFLNNAIVGALDIVLNGPIQAFNGLMQAMNNAWGTNFALVEEFDFSSAYEEFSDHISFEEGRAGGNWFYQPEAPKGRQTGGDLGFASGAIHGVLGESGLDENQYLYGPQMGSSEPIQIYLDGKQIYGAVRKAELVSGSRVARGLLAE